MALPNVKSAAQKTEDYSSTRLYKNRLYAKLICISDLDIFSGARKMNSIPAPSESATSPRLLDQVRGKIRLKHYSLRTEQTCGDWIKRFVRHFGKRHPRDLGAAEAEAFPTDLAVVGKVAASTQSQAKSALLFLYREVLANELPWLDNVEQAKYPGGSRSF